MLHWFPLAGACVLLVLGTLVLGSGSESSPAGSGGFEGLGAVFAGLALIVGLVALGLAVALLVFTSKGRRRADAGDPRTLRNVGIAAIGLGVLTFVGVFDRGNLGGLAVPLAIVASYVFVGARMYLALRD